MNGRGICGPKFWTLDKPGEDKSGRRCSQKILIAVGPVGSEVFFYIITYFFNKIKPIAPALQENITHMTDR